MSQLERASVSENNPLRANGEKINDNQFPKNSFQEISKKISLLNLLQGRSIIERILCTRIKLALVYFTGIEKKERLKIEYIRKSA